MTEAPIMSMSPRAALQKVKLPPSLDGYYQEIHVSTNEEFMRAIGKSDIKSLFRRGFVYLAASRRSSNGHIKIGFSGNLRNRMHALGADCLFYAYASFAHELALHRLYAHRRVWNEWYSLDDDELFTIQCLLTPSEYERSVLA